MGADYDATETVAENYWSDAQPWNAEFDALLDAMLQVVTWREALARAAADLLEGQWARDYLAPAQRSSALWPSQVAGIAEALWVVENVGSVLIADATGSGKTRMGAYLTRAVRDRRSAAADGGPSTARAPVLRRRDRDAVRRPVGGRAPR